MPADQNWSLTPSRGRPLTKNCSMEPSKYLKDSGLRPYRCTYALSVVHRQLARKRLFGTYPQVRRREVASHASFIVDDGDATDLVAVENLESVYNTAIHPHSNDGLDGLELPYGGGRPLWWQQIGFGNRESDQVRKAHHTGDCRSFILHHAQLKTSAAEGVTHLTLSGSSNCHTMQAMLEPRSAEE